MTLKRIHAAFFPLGVAATACTPAVTTTTSPAVTPAVQSAAAVPRKEVHWFRNSAEMRGIYLEVYRLASEQLDKMASENAPGTWAVIMNADETLIDNSTFEKELGTAPYTEAAWYKWVERKAAGALPGTVQFTRLVHRLSGKVVVVTNRESAHCDVLRETFRADSIEADLVLCRTTSGDKNLRFDAVQKGTAAPGVPALKVLMWFGAHIQDFPNQTQSLRDRADSYYADFGRIYFLLPNPMYGSWEKVPYR